MLYDEWKCQVSCYTKKAKLEAQSLSFSTPNSEKETNRCPAALPSAVRMVLIALLVFWCFSISAGCYFSLFWHKLGYGLTLTLVPVRASHFGVSLRSPSCSKTCCAFKQVGGIPSAPLQPACQGQGCVLLPMSAPAPFPTSLGCWVLQHLGPLGVAAAHDSRVFWLSCNLQAPVWLWMPQGLFLAPWPRSPELGGPRASRWQHGTADGSAHCSRIWESQGLPSLEMRFSHLRYFKVNAGQAYLACLH